MNVQAWPKPDGTFYLDGKTYHAREAIKQAGGTWDGKHWVVSDEQRASLGIQRMVRVAVKGCHQKPDWTYVPEDNAIIGTVIGCFCCMCDSRYRSEIVEVES